MYLGGYESSGLRCTACLFWGFYIMTTFKVISGWGYVYSYCGENAILGSCSSCVSKRVYV